jgi:DNA repair protein RecN (Recombination protein N)
MIQEIQIRNFNIIEKTQVRFYKGFHALSGETGAGKSFLLQALAFVLGARSDTEVIRAGAEEASVTLSFENIKSTQVWERCREWGVEADACEGPLYLRRTLNRAGKSRATINDQIVTLKALQTVGNLLVHQVGQHAARQLLEEFFLFTVLDRFAKSEASLEEYREAFRDHHAEQENLNQLRERVAKSREQEEFFRFQCKELENAGLREGEEGELELQKQRLKHRVALAGHAYEISQCLSEGEDAVVDRLGRVLHLGEKAAGLDESLLQWLGPLREAVEKVAGAARGFSAYARELREEPDSYDLIESRLALIHELKRKYRMEEKELIDKLAGLKTKLSELEDFENILQQQTQKAEAALRRLEKGAAKLRALRKKAASEISALLKSKLKELALPHAKISWILEALPSLEDYKSHGGDALQLLVSFNPGEELRPFQEVISGGELSRLLLALYEVLYPAQMFETFIFDEVDAGVGGGVAELIGRKLKGLGQDTQVLCITHLPQIASQAQWHLYVEKQVRGGRTFSEIRELGSEERVQEIARMLAGVKVSSQAIQHARELLKNNVA